MWSVEARRDYALVVGFADGTTRLFDFAPYLRAMFSWLSDPDAFMGAHVAHGTVDWGRDTDIAPERLYREGVVL